MKRSLSPRPLISKSDSKEIKFQDWTHQVLKFLVVLKMTYLLGPIKNLKIWKFEIRDQNKKKTKKSFETRGSKKYVLQKGRTDAPCFSKERTCRTPISLPTDLGDLYPSSFTRYRGYRYRRVFLSSFTPPSIVHPILTRVTWFFEKSSTQSSTAVLLVVVMVTSYIITWT